MEKSKYSDLIAKIQRKRRWVVVLCTAVTVLLLLFVTPANLEVAGETILGNEGVHPILLIVLFFLCLLVEGIVYAAVSLPLNTSMVQECDPEKHLVLNMQLNKQKNIDYIYANDYLYLGIYAPAIEYSEKMIKSPKKVMVLVGLFNKARCEFLLDDYCAFRESADKYKATLSNAKKLKPKVKEVYEKIGRIIDFMLAIMENDIERIDELRSNIEVWNESKATEGFVNYIKGVAAYKAEDKEEAIYRFKGVKDNCSKTVFAKLSDEYLELLK